MGNASIVMCFMLIAALANAFVPSVPKFVVTTPGT